MPRVTTDLAERTHRALKEAAAREGRPLRRLIEERLASERGPSADRAREIVARRRQRIAGIEPQATHHNTR